MNTEILKSTGDRKCLTKCNAKQVSFIHPTTLDIIQGRTTSICAVNPEYRYKTQLKDNATYQRLIYDQCNLDDNNNKILPNIIESLLLQNTFDTLEFLNKIYNLYSFDDIIKWTVSNDYMPNNTIKRVHNCGWQVFVNGKTNDTKHPTIKVYDYYFNMFKTKWIKNCIKKLEKEYSLNILLNNDNTLENLLTSKYINLDTTIKFISSFIKYNTKEWSNLENYYSKIRNYCIDSIIEQVKNDYNKH